MRADSIYREYKIWGEEDREVVNCLFQFRQGGPDGPTLVLEEGKVHFDDELLTPDSTTASGAYYESLKPLASFAGKHTVTFTDAEGRTNKEIFSFQPFALKNSWGEEVKREELLLQLEGLKTGDVLRVVATDTVFYNEGINELDTIQNGELDLRKRIRSFKGGPVILHLYKEEERSLKNGRKEIGRISITYGLKREFLLRD